MADKTKKIKFQTKKKKRGVLTAVSAIMVLLLVAVVFFFSKGRIGEKTETEVSETEAEGFGLEHNVSIVKSEGLTGTFPEDGGDSPAENVLAITLANKGDSLIQYMTIKLNGRYSFKVTDLLPGTRMVVWEENKAEFPENFRIETAELGSYAEYTELPSLHENLMEIGGIRGNVTVKNLTEDVLIPSVTVYYKKVKNDVLQGGITYRVKTGSLKPGAFETVSAGHFDPTDCRIMFTTYGN